MASSAFSSLRPGTAHHSARSGDTQRRCYHRPRPRGTAHIRPRPHPRPITGPQQTSPCIDQQDPTGTAHRRLRSQRTSHRRPRPQSWTVIGPAYHGPRLPLGLPTIDPTWAHPPTSLSKDRPPQATSPAPACHRPCSAQITPRESRPLGIPLRTAHRRLRPQRTAHQRPRPHFPLGPPSGGRPLFA